MGIKKSEKEEEIVKEAKRLSELSDAELFEELGFRIEDIKNVGGYSRALNVSGNFTEGAVQRGLFDDLIKKAHKIGKDWWENLEPELMKLVCDEKNADIKLITSGKTIPEIATALTTATVISTFAPPAWIIIATTILARKIAQSGLDALCQNWGNP